MYKEKHSSQSWFKWGISSSLFWHDSTYNTKHPCFMLRTNTKKRWSCGAGIGRQLKGQSPYGERTGAWVQIPRTRIKLGMIAHACNPILQQQDWQKRQQNYWKFKKSNLAHAEVNKCHILSQDGMQGQTPMVVLWPPPTCYGMDMFILPYKHICTHTPHTQIKNLWYYVSKSCPEHQWYIKYFDSELQKPLLLPNLLWPFY